jgi:hypothetical protein
MSSRFIPQNPPAKPTAPVAEPANARTADTKPANSEPGSAGPDSAEPDSAEPDSAGVQLYFGQATETGCRVHAVYRAAAEPASVDPQGVLYGPESPYAATLRARHPFGRRPGAADKPAEAWIAEPCFWTPAAPYVYRYEFRFPAPAAPVTGILGIRRLAAQGDHLVFDRKHWVLRGAWAEPLAEIVPGEFSLGHVAQGEGAGVLPAGEQRLPLAAWHEVPLAAAADNPPDRLCELASRLGVLLVARVAGGADVGAELRRLARWPAVGIAILAAPPNDDDPRRHARNLLFAQSVSAGAALKPAAWAHLLFCEVADAADFARKVAGCRLPIVALRPGGDWSSPVEARAACDRLQRDLAAEGLQMAGYLV